MYPAKELWVKLEKNYSVKQRAEARLVILEDDSEDEENPLMGTVASENDSHMEGEVDLKEELISPLEELRKSNMNNYLKEKLSKYQEEKNFKKKKKNLYSKEETDYKDISEDEEILFIGTTNSDEK